ncbi:hypothetical protein QQP08_006206 [Theobroma cacao]|nr:hypothetical protein QQP08_006206 [Theobroma cacao]
MKADYDCYYVKYCEIAGFFLLCRNGGGLGGFTEEEDGREANGEGDDREHDEEFGGVVGEECGAEVGEDGGAETDIAFQDAGYWATVAAEVVDAIRKWLNLMTDDEPLSTITNQPFNGTNKENNRGGQTIRGKASQETKSLTNIFSHRQIVKLELGKVHERLDSIRVVRKSVVIA